MRQILLALPGGAVAVFYQTDVRLAKVGQVSKAFLVLQAASEVPQVPWESRMSGGLVTPENPYGHPTREPQPVPDMMNFRWGTDPLHDVSQLMRCHWGHHQADLGSCRTVPSANFHC